ncbi:MAG: hypothetical protein ACE5I5_20105 [Candidatus Heimdallarchaeota archaeon]
MVLTFGGVGTFLGAPLLRNRIDIWRETAFATRDALQQLGIAVPKLTEKEALKRMGIPTS